VALVSNDRLEVFHSRADNTEVIVCRGWLDEGTCDQLEELIDGAVQDRIARLRVDLRNLLGVDDAGVRCLLSTQERCRASGIHLELETNRPILASLTTTARATSRSDSCSPYARRSSGPVEDRPSSSKKR
jgi:anti-anti-sigma regulatory factor